MNAFRSPAGLGSAHELPATPSLVHCLNPPTGDRWERLQATLKAAVGSTGCLWLERLHSHGMDGGTLVLGYAVGDRPRWAAAVGWVRHRHRHLLESAAGMPVRVEACDHVFTTEEE